MPALKIGIQLASLRQPIRQALHTAARLGAAGVEIDLRHELRGEELSQTGLRQFRKLLDDLNLRVSAVAFPTRRGYDDPQDLERRLSATRRAMTLAQQLGAKVVVNRVGQIPEDEASGAWQRLLESLHDLGAHGHRVGAVLAAKTGGESGADLARLLDALPPGAIGIDLDPRGLILADHSPQEAVGVLGPHVLHVHAGDAVRDLSAQRAVEVTLGRGAADFPALLGALEEFNYRGWFTLERQTAADPERELGDAVQYLRSL